MDVGITLPSFVRGADRAVIVEWCRRVDDGPFVSISVGERIAYPSHELATPDEARFRVKQMAETKAAIESERQVKMGVQDFITATIRKTATELVSEQANRSSGQEIRGRRKGTVIPPDAVAELDT